MPTSTERSRALSALLVMLVVATACGPSGLASPSATCPGARDSAPTTESDTIAPEGGDLVILGRIVTMDEPGAAEALLMEDGLVTCVGSRDEVLARAGAEVPVVDIGSGVAYPGFIDAHAHWIGDREIYGINTAEEAMDAALRRGWTTISEQWVNPERLDELARLAAQDALPLRVDAYLALNYGDEFFGDWYDTREPGLVEDRLVVQGVKIHLDSGNGDIINWEPADLAETVGRADAAGWQVSVHAVSTEAQDLVLDAFEAALGAAGPNPLHHRIEHAIEVSDEQLERMVGMDLVTVIHPDGVAVDWVLWTDYLGQGAGYPAEQLGWLGRWRDFVEAGLHVAGATDAPWFFPDAVLADDVGRPVDLIAGWLTGAGGGSSRRHRSGSSGSC